MAYEFHNPYNFINTPDRREVLSHPFAGDHDPSDYDRQENHSRYWDNCYTGEIPVRLRTQTPLFITDPSTRVEFLVGSGHYVYDCTKGVPATAIKGMLSSNYEIITNSRYRVFSQKQQTRRFGYRDSAEAKLVPGLIEERDGQMFVRLFTGTSEIGPNGANGPLYAAWLPTYRRGSMTPLHPLSDGLYRDVQLRLYKHQRGFTFWSVEKIGDMDFSPITSNASLDPSGRTLMADGYVVISGKIFINKHDERFFFSTQDHQLKPIPIKKEFIERYEDLIADYQRVHADEDNKADYGAHITDEKRRRLQAGDFVYVKTPDGHSLNGIYPVQISRELNDIAPWRCLFDSLKPASTITELSPADRVFGWVWQKDPGQRKDADKDERHAWRGKVRITCATPCNGEDPVERFQEPIPLTVLGGPKPAQARFYLGNERGEPQKDGIPKQNASYQEEKQIRGRKVYLHHTLHHISKEDREGYWEPRSSTRLIREYQRFTGKDDEAREKQKLSNQTRSIRGWIPRRTDFTFKIRFENLTGEELGALLTLLSLDQEYLRLGFAKPLGLGSVKLSILWDKPIPICTGKDLRLRYGTLKESPAPVLTEKMARSLIQRYQKAMSEAYGGLPDGGPATEIDRFPWEKMAFAKDLNDAQKKVFRAAWQAALEDGGEVPLDALPEHEMLLELYPELEKELADALKGTMKALQEFEKYDFGWSKLPFIRDFRDAMRGFQEKRPVTYPRTHYTSFEEGFQWFAENEKNSRKKPLIGYSLPPIGEPLKGF